MTKEVGRLFWKGRASLEREQSIGKTKIYSCPTCQADTPHIIKGRKDETLALVCSNCTTGSLVQSDELYLYQLHWEEELRQILGSLEQDFEDDKHFD
ncbi:MAG: hypothetical protein GX316_02760 [Firmicutes bacterium]|nr:hypothetical protein [Bacillota bacterium]